MLPLYALRPLIKWKKFMPKGRDKEVKEPHQHEMADIQAMEVEIREIQVEMRRLAPFLNNLFIVR